MRNWEIISFKIGKVHRGYGRGSRKLGYPTANFPQFESFLNRYNLKNGVYYGYARVPTFSSIYPFVCNIGLSPTFSGQENPCRIIETYVIDLPKSPDFYEKPLTIGIVGYLRPEIKFASVEELRKTIGEDVVAAKSALADFKHSQLRRLHHFEQLIKATQDIGEKDRWEVVV